MHTRNGNNLREKKVGRRERESRTHRNRRARTGRKGDGELHRGDMRDADKKTVKFRRRAK